eukprot:1967147-Rhodomonas_salina.1
MNLKRPAVTVAPWTTSSLQPLMSTSCSLDYCWTMTAIDDEDDEDVTDEKDSSSAVMPWNEKLSAAKSKRIRQTQTQLSRGQ